MTNPKAVPRVLNIPAVVTLVSVFFAARMFSQDDSDSRERLKALDRIHADDQKAKNKDTDDSKPRALTADELVGDWMATKIGEDDASKTKVKIRFKDEKSKELVLEGEYKDWKQDGEVVDGKIVFMRKPKAEEMSEKAPKWARDMVQAQGKLKWKMELKGELRDKEAHLDGKWFPGELEWRAAAKPHPDLPVPGERQAQYLGPGKPLDVQFKKRIPKYFLYANCVRGLQSIEELYLGVPTLIEAQFDPEYDADEYPIELKAGEQKLKLVARKIDKKGMIFRTDFFVPGKAKETPSNVKKDEAWDVSPPPKNP